MTEKRFTIEIDDKNFAHILDNNTDIGQYNLCRLLNELNEENQFLKRQVDELDGLLNKYGLTFEELEEKLGDFE